MKEIEKTENRRIFAEAKLKASENAFFKKINESNDLNDNL